MATAFSIQVLTPEGKVWEGRATAVNAPGVLGSFGVLARHQPMVAALQSGHLVIIAEDEKRIQFHLSGGVLEVTGFHDVLVLADSTSPV